MKTIYLVRHSLKEQIEPPNDVIDKQLFDENKKLSEEGRKRAIKLSKMDLFKNVNEVWASKYERAIETASYICDRKGIRISGAFDERHYGDFDKNSDRDIFWAEQFNDPDLKNVNGESQKDVRKRYNNKINYILKHSSSNEIAIFSHNAAILFYLLKYCKLIKAEAPKKLTIKYKDKILINESIMQSPSIMKLVFDNNKLISIEYIDI